MTPVSMSRLRAAQHQTFLLRFALLALLAIVGVGCDQPVQSVEETRSTDPMPPTTASEADTEIASPLADKANSDAPECNALVRRISEEMLPCLQRVKPELAEQLEITINTFRNGPRLRLDLPDRDNVLKQVEEECEFHWRQVQNQLDSKAPEGQCLLKASR
jgi:hypothetical protein